LKKYWLPIVLIIILIAGILVVKKMNTQSLSAHQENISGTWELYMNIPKQPNVSIAYYHGVKTPQTVAIHVEQEGNVLCISILGKEAGGYLDGQKIHFYYLTKEGSPVILIFHNFDGAVSQDGKTMNGQFTVKFYEASVKGEWKALKK
jgi:hypothetical protein